MKAREKRAVVRALGVLALVCATDATAVAAVLKADFNGDGREDLAVGSPLEDVGSVRDAGAVSVFYGGAKGLPAEPSQQWHQDVPGVGGAPGIEGSAETDDLFGFAVAAGDFNDDGFDDLAVGVPQEHLVRRPGENDRGRTGVVNVIYGSAFGLQLIGNRFLTMDLQFFTATDANLGSALAAADFNGDGYDDLAAGAPDATLGAASDGGVPVIFLGGPQGLPKVGTTIRARVEPHQKRDHFGTTLAAADFDRDGFADLAVGAPDDDVEDAVNAGSVEIVYGSPDFGRDGGFTLRRNAITDIGGGDRPEFDDRFGASLTAGDFNCDAYPDLAIGRPRETVPGAARAGGVTVVFGGRFGATGGVRDEWPADRFPLPGKAERDDHFGSALAGGDFDGDGCADLAIGIPEEDQERFLSDRPDVGHVTVLYGRRNGLFVRGDSDWHQDRSGVESSRGDDNFFGFALSVGDFNGDAFADLVVGVPGETVYLSNSPPIFRSFSGMAHVFYGTRAGLSTDPKLGREVLTESKRTGKPSLVEKDDGFGSALP